MAGSVSTVNPKANQSEDCLFWNLYRPRIDNATNSSHQGFLPVLFWIHGGGFTVGSGGDVDDGSNAFDARTLATSQRAVVISINCRLGPLAFLLQNAESSKPGGFNGMRDVITSRRHLSTLRR